MQIIAFALPLYQKLIAPLLLLWFLVASTIIITQYKRLSKGPLLNPVLIIYLLSCVWVVFSTDFSLALNELEIKLSFLLMPLGFYFIGNYLPDKKRVLQAFVSGVFIAIVLNVIRSAIMYNLTSEVSVFYYTDFSFFIHPSYFSMYIVFSIAIILQYWVNNEPLYEIKYLNFSVLFALILGVFLSTSKTGLISLLFLFIGYALYYGYLKKKWKMTLMFLTVLTIAFVGLVSVSQTVQNRFKELFVSVQEQPQTGTSSTASRMVIWDVSYDLIKENPLGYGTGMAVSTLRKAYLEKGHHKAFKRKQNAHNQFFQTGLTLGVIGLLALLWLFIQPILSFSTIDNLFFVLLLILFFNFITEAMLERQAGVVFAAFFYSYFFYYRRGNLQDQ